MGLRELRNGKSSGAGLHCGKKSAKGNIDDLDVSVQPRPDLLNKIDLETDIVAILILEFPGHIAYVRAYGEIGCVCYLRSQ